MKVSLLKWRLLSAYKVPMHAHCNLFHSGINSIKCLQVVLFTVVHRAVL